jgi:SAM-dependent methyltransferase
VATKLIYRNGTLYDFIIRLLYGRHYATHYAVIADLIPAGASVLDLCCGSAALYHHYLRAKSVRYTGLDTSPFFIKALARRGGSGLIWDLHSEKPLPRADFVVIQGALHLFLPEPGPLIERMLGAAIKQVIVSEPIRNLSSSRFSVVSRIANRISGGPAGSDASRFTEETLDRLFERYAAELKRSFKIPGGRDKVYILEKPATVSIAQPPFAS